VHVYVTMLVVPPGSPAASSTDAEVIRDALWAHASAVAGIEHITATAVPAGIGIAVFMNHSTADPEERVRALLLSAVRQSPILSRWREDIEKRGEYKCP
jgi:hypothetical protein